jgi:hypothetical protein
MKILVTGYTTRQFNSKRIHNDYITFSYVLVDILKEMGHDVYHKSIEIKEKVSYEYNYAFCGVAPLSSMTSGKVPETHYVMDSLPGRHCLYADDWSFCGYGKSIRYALKDWPRYIDYKKFPYDISMLEATKDSLDKIIYIDNPGNNSPVLAPMFPWGDHEFLMRDNYCATLHTIDPSPWIKYPSITIPPFSEKKKQWVMAALSDHSSWVKKQGFTLPVLTVGNKRMGDGIVLTEDDTIKLFSQSFGVLACGYPSAGSGWWRSRFLNAAWAETLVYADPKDQVIMGAPYWGSVGLFESVYDGGYRVFVEEQNNWLNKNLGTKEQAMETLEKLMK